MMLNVEVAYARPDRQEILKLRVPEGTSVREAVALSGICEIFPEINPDTITMGIFSKVVKNPVSHALREGDRVELYRPLTIDPKQARLNRAKKKA